MLNNYFLLSEQARFLNEKISGCIVKEIFTYEKNKFVIVLENNADEISLEFSIVRNYNYLLLLKKLYKAKKNYVNLFEEVYGKKILKISLYNDDRIICFSLNDDSFILFTFFSNNANCFLVKDSIILNSFKDKKEYLNKNISEIISQRKTKLLDGVKVNTVGLYIKEKYRNFGDLYLKEALSRSKLKEENFIDDKTKKTVEETLNEIELTLNEPVYFLYTGNNEFHISLLKLNHLVGYEVKEFEDSNSLIAEYIKLKFRSGKIQTVKEENTKELVKKISGLNKKITGLEKQLSHSEDSEKLKKSGNMILQNIGTIKKGDTIFYSEDENNNKWEIKLKENLSPAENAQRYFDKYKNQKNSVNILKAKIINLKENKTKLESELETLKKLSDYKALLKKENKSENKIKDETSKFRKFKLNDKYEVWVGKDSASNDLLTTKYASPHDLWFHVRGAGGSHTILRINNKKAQASKEIINAAGSIAAYYSKARNASSVPVAYCEKKYVKKKKGFKEGSVLMEREKVIFVKPSLPYEN